MFFSTSHSRGMKVINALTNLGLTSSLQLCLDAGDSNSYSSGTKWLDVSGNGYDFNFGAAGAAPTFNGTAGYMDASCYFGMDGGDYFTYDTTNEPWMNNLHKDNATWTMYAWVWFGSLGGVQQGIFGTDALALGNVGVHSGAFTTNNYATFVRNGSGTTALNINPGAAAACTAGGWAFYSISVNEATGAGGALTQVNDVNSGTSSTYSSPSAAAATATMQIGAIGSNSTIISASSRIGSFTMYSTAHTSSNQLDVFNATRGRYGV